MSQACARWHDDGAGVAVAAAPSVLFVGVGHPAYRLGIVAVCAAAGGELGGVRLLLEQGAPQCLADRPSQRGQLLVGEQLADAIEKGERLLRCRADAVVPQHARRDRVSSDARKLEAVEGGAHGEGGAAGRGHSAARARARATRLRRLELQKDLAGERLEAVAAERAHELDPELFLGAAVERGEAAP